MSDALTDIARDEKRSGYYGELVYAVRKHLVHRTQETLDAAVKAAEAVDSVSGGYWGRRTNYRSMITKHLDRLLRKDRVEWLKFLKRWDNDSQTVSFSIFEKDKEAETWFTKRGYETFKALSPFGDNTILIFIEIGIGYNLRKTSHELHFLFKKELAKLNMQEKEGDHFALLFDQKTGKAEVVYLESPGCFTEKDGKFVTRESIVRGQLHQTAV